MRTLRSAWVATLLGVALVAGGCGTTASNVRDGVQTLTIYTARDKDEVAAVVRQFVQQYPQYEGHVNVVTLSAQDALTRLRAERMNPQAGFLWGGTQQALQQAAAEGLLAASTATHAYLIDPSRRDPQGRWYAEMLLPEVIVYNRDRLTAAQAPRDWDDLITERFRGQILIRDVMASGTMRTIYSAMIFRQFVATGSPEAGYAWLRRLDANTVNYAANPDDMYFKLDRGVGTVTLWNLQDVLIQAFKKHRPWGYVMPASGAPVLLDCVGIVNNPNSLLAARDFQNFLLEPTLQAQLARDYYQIPAMTLPDASRPDWLKTLNLTEMRIDWEVIRQHQTAWMAFWSQHIQGLGGRS